MNALRIEISGPTASFRFPHFLIGRQPTFPMPPPSTIYGLLTCAAGIPPDPASISFAYRFECEGERIDDIEKIWFLEPNKSTRGPSKEFNLEGNSNILPREWLIFPRLTLYLAGESLDFWINAFRSPRYPPVLGRSQDLASIRTVTKVTLEKANHGRLGPGLFSPEMAEVLPAGEMLRMPRVMDPTNRENRSWGLYIAVSQFLLAGPNRAVCLDGSLELWADAALSPGEPHLIEFHHFSNAD